MASESTDRESPVLGEEGVLTAVFGNHSKVKILTALSSEDWHDISVNKIAALAGIDESTVYNHIRDLVQLGVVEPTREVSGSQLYQINRENTIAKMTKNLEEEILQQEELSQTSLSESTEEDEPIE